MYVLALKQLATDLSTESFLNAFKRFISRRGICKKIYSDNGTNFQGDNNELIKLKNIVSNSKFTEYCQQNFIEWIFIPPRAPHFGGIWEAGVKSVKDHLIKILGNNHFTFEGFYTVCTQVEAILNSRPLSPLSNDSTDYQALTPAHFLIGETFTSIPQEDVTEIKQSR